MEDNLEHGPTFGPEKSPSPRGENEEVPGGDSEGTDHEIFVCAEMGREVEGIGEGIARG